MTRTTLRTETENKFKKQSVVILVMFDSLTNSNRYKTPILKLAKS